jgi:hypothetical protein
LIGNEVRGDRRCVPNVGLHVIKDLNSWRFRDSRRLAGRLDIGSFNQVMSEKLISKAVQLLLRCRNPVKQREIENRLDVWRGVSFARFNEGRNMSTDPILARPEQRPHYGAMGRKQG